MSDNDFTKYIEILNEYDEKEYLFYTIAYNAAPAMAQVKPSSLIVFSNSNRNLKKNWHKYKEVIKSKLTIDFYEVVDNKKYAIVLFYDKTMLENIINTKGSVNFLKRFGYKHDMTLVECLQHLSSRYGKMCPHEIGIFLGYPLSDVAVFTHCPNKKCLLVGYWKVYFNIEQAREVFNKYDMAKNNIIYLLINGIKPTTIICDGLLKTA